MKLRELVRDDAARCAELEMQLFAGETPWSKENFELEFWRKNGIPHLQMIVESKLT